MSPARAVVASLSVRPTQVDDLDALSAFLQRSFPGGMGARQLSSHVLRWKYIDRLGPVPLSYCADAGDEFVGHVGLAVRALRVQEASTSHVTDAVHFMDWIANPRSGPVAMVLARCGLRTAPIVYLLGGSDDGRAVSMACGLSARGAFPVMRRELRAWPLAASTSGRSLARAMRRAMRRMMSRPRRSSVGVSLREVAAFDGEPTWVMDRIAGSMAFIERSAALLNYALRYPAATTFGYTLHVGERLCGIALLRVIPRDDQRLGRIVDCLLSDRDVDLWHGSLLALSDALREHGADTATFYASLPWSAEAAARAGFRSERLQPVFIREAPFPAALPLYVSQLEADHGLY